MKTNVHLWSPSILFRMREVLHKSCRENADTHLTVSTLISLSVHSSHCQYTHLTVSNIFPLKSSLLWYNVEKYCRAGQTINENTEHAHCMLDNQGYTHTHTHRICNTYCFPRQQYLHEDASKLLYTHTARLVYQAIQSSFIQFNTTITTIRSYSNCFTTICPNLQHVSFFLCL